MKTAIVAVVMIAMAAVVQEAYGATHTVGGSSGWTQGVNYTTWASGETFTVGDTLVFTYGPTHAVDQVSESDYTNCNTGNAIQTYNGGSNSIALGAAGPMYFICPTPGHCQNGMKLPINVVASSTAPTTSPPTPTTSPATPTTPPSTPSSNPPPPPPPSSGAVGSSGNSNALHIGASVLAAAVLGMMC